MINYFEGHELFKKHVEKSTYSLLTIDYMFKVLRFSGLMKEISTNSVSIQKLNG